MMIMPATLPSQVCAVNAILDKMLFNKTPINEKETPNPSTNMNVKPSKRKREAFSTFWPAKKPRNAGIKGRIQGAKNEMMPAINEIKKVISANLSHLFKEFSLIPGFRALQHNFTILYDNF